MRVAASVRGGVGWPPVDGNGRANFFGRFGSSDSEPGRHLLGALMAPRVVHSGPAACQLRRTVAELTPRDDAGKRRLGITTFIQKVRGLPWCPKFRPPTASDRRAPSGSQGTAKRGQVFSAAVKNERHAVGDSPGAGTCRPPACRGILQRWHPAAAVAKRPREVRPQVGPRPLPVPLTNQGPAANLRVAFPTAWFGPGSSRFAPSCRATLAN